MNLDNIVYKIKEWFRSLYNDMDYVLTRYFYCDDGSAEIPQ